MRHTDYFVVKSCRSSHVMTIVKENSMQVVLFKEHDQVGVQVLFIMLMCRLLRNLMDAFIYAPLCSTIKFFSCMLSVPEDLKYAKTHEWLKAEGEKGTMGLTSFAVEELGDVVYVELPDVGSKYESGESICTVESVKASSSVYAPAGGEVLEVNESLKDAPERLNKEPYGEWLVKLKLANAKDLDSLLDAHAYHAVTKKEKH
ncbi:hypothetical protein KP509_20G049200 [Ceratopteris richardii]|uniref:Glycine cleavage system H protein n=1 Tax=Ceratopteris richardii TaxID=49495 RepID=A0A8T2SFV3_CERRI|nr:hypothetical protein KP509_20G049200 [Ceratopteris richardii]